MKQLSLFKGPFHQSQGRSPLCVGGRPLAGIAVIALLSFFGMLTNEWALPVSANTAPTTSAPMVTQALSDTATLTLSQQMELIRLGDAGVSLASFDAAPASSLVAGTEMAPPSGYKSPQPALQSPWGFFASPTGTFGSISTGLPRQHANFYGFGLLGGADYQFSKALTAGFYAGYDHAKTEYASVLAGAEDNVTRFGLFTAWQDQSHDWVDASVGGAYHELDNSVLSGVGGTSALGNAQGMELDSTLQYGHDFRFGAWTLTPTAGLDYIRLAVDGYRTDSTTSLNYGDQDSNSLRSKLGTTLSYAFKTGSVKWNPYLRGGWNHEFLDDVTESPIIGTGIPNQPLGREAATFGVGVNAILSPTYSANFGYEGEADSYYQSYSLEASLHVVF